MQLLDNIDVVIGPSDDGGYYLVAARQAVSKMFSGIHWGTEEVLPKTLQALRVTPTSFRLLKRDFDLDRPEDLRRVGQMAARGKLRAPALTRWLRESSRLPKPNLPHKKRRLGLG